jgi:hypothetical protein
MNATPLNLNYKSLTKSHFALLKLSQPIQILKIFNKNIKSFILFNVFYSQPKIEFLGCDNRSGGNANGS